MEIRFLNENDGVSFCELRLRALKEEPTAFSSDYQSQAARPLEDRLKQFRQNTTEPDKFILGAFEGTRLVGIAGLRRKKGQKTVIMLLYGASTSLPKHAVRAQVKLCWRL